MAYCANCGTEVVRNAKFCQKCGHPTGTQNDSSKRRQEFAGKIYKCPNCGEVLKAFEINCPACGHELRGTKASSAVKEFALKLEAIESRREYEKPRGFFAAAEARERISKTDEQKISLIKTFSVPNSKEDMLEFMILATSSMNMRAYDSANTSVSKSEKEINAAWFSKVQQVYEKAKCSYSTDSTFTEIKALYDSCNDEIRKSKKKGIIKWFLMVGWIPLLWIILIVFLSISEPKDEAKELQRLENIVAEVQIALDNEEYKHALRIADSIDYQRYDVEMERKWDIQREYWVDKVLAEAKKRGIDLEYIPSPDVDRANKEDSEEQSSGGFAEGFMEGLQPGLDSAQENVDEFQEQMEVVKEQWDDMLNSPTEAETEPAVSSETTVLHIKNFTFDLPTYWEEEGSKVEYLQYYAEKGDKVVMLGIGYPEEDDENYDVSFAGLYADNNNMIKAVASPFDKSDVVSNQVFESQYGIKGMLYHFTCQQKISWLKSIDASGYCFCFPSEKDRRWFYVYYLETSNVSGNTYTNDYMALISSVKEKE